MQERGVYDKLLFHSCFENIKKKGLKLFYTPTLINLISRRNLTTAKQGITFGKTLSITHFKLFMAQ